MPVFDSYFNKVANLKDFSTCAFYCELRKF